MDTYIDVIDARDNGAAARASAALPVYDLASVDDSINCWSGDDTVDLDQDDRVRDPQRHREFRTPLVPLVPILGIVTCAVMIFGLGVTNWLRLGVWLILGLVVYFAYSQKHSKLGKQQ